MHAKPIEGHQDRLNLAVLPAHKLAKTPGTDLLTLYPLPSFPHITPRPSAGIHIYKVESSEEASRERETGNRSPCAQSQHRRGGVHREQRTEPPQPHRRGGGGCSGGAAARNEMGQDDGDLTLGELLRGGDFVI
ncbi:hypothetical protein EHS25_007015 [Saitozyma podzolica]|uniref:Uncharacterized protein n=1 Tax=Saitozyma podzolica TaxID=1890683 RepID=A0A427XPS9_9TREE|nr:hypothetical protein EHS25_007015 [Saitozyma podzolica]